LRSTCPSGALRGRCPSAGRVLVGIGGHPSGGLEEPAGGGVDVVAPRREQLDVTPVADAGGDVEVDLEDHEREAPLVEVGSAGEAAGAGSDDGNG
jgi:hypothetical protein